MRKLMRLLRSRLAVLMLVLALPAAAPAQLVLTTNNGTIAITGYAGDRGAVSVIIPSATNGLPVTAIGGFAFLGAGVTGVLIPDSVTSIGEGAFYGCNSLTNLVIPNSVVSIGDWAFSYCGSLTNVTIPDSVISIGEYAFSYCGGLRNVTIGSGLTGIEDHTFDPCVSLTNITIGSGVTSLGYQAFANCFGLTRVYFQGNAPILGGNGHVFPTFNKLTVYYAPGTTGWGKTFAGYPTILWSPSFGALQVAISPPGAVSAGARWQVDGGAWQNSGATVYLASPGGHTVSFSTVSGWTAPASQAVTVNAGQTTTTTGTYVKIVGSLQVTITPSGAVAAGAEWQVDGGAWRQSGTVVSNLFGSIHTIAFSTVTGWLTPPDQVVKVVGNQTTTAAGAYQVVINGVICTTANAAITVTGYAGTGGVVVIPSEVNGLPVTTIGVSAFYGSASITGITIPNSVTSIGANAFEFCTSLTNVTIPNSVISIGEYAFSGCASLTNVTIGNGATSIGDGAFDGCTSLTSVTLGQGVTTIGASAFYVCASLTRIKIPDSVTNIGANAFAFCTSLTNVTLGNAVTSIGNQAFAYTSLTTVGFPGNAPSADATVFDGDNTATVYYLPAATGWGATFGGRPTMLWNAQVQTRNASFGVRTNQFGFTITGSSGLVVVVEASSDLINPAWSPLATKTLSGGSFYFTDPQWTNYARRFYRLTWP